MWQREQKPSKSEPGRETEYDDVPMSNSLAHVPGLAKGFGLARGVPSGGSGVSQLPWVETARASKRNAARHTGSRQALDIIEPFHWSKISRWQFRHCPGWLCV